MHNDTNTGLTKRLKREIKTLRTAGIIEGVPPDELTDERLEQRITARRQWVNGIAQEVIAKRVARMQGL